MTDQLSFNFGDYHDEIFLKKVGLSQQSNKSNPVVISNKEIFRKNILDEVTEDGIGSFFIAKA